MLAIAAIFLLSAVSLPSAEALEVSLNEQNLLELINQDRSVYGLPALTPDGRLTEAAGMKAEHMLANDYFAHTSPQGVRPWEFLDQAGFPYRSAGENLALNYQNAYELIEDFMQSPSHPVRGLSGNRHFDRRRRTGWIERAGRGVYVRQRAERGGLILYFGWFGPRKSIGELGKAPADMAGAFNLAKWIF